MAVVLTKVIVGYVLGILFAFHDEWVRVPQVTLMKFGAVSPGLMNISLVLVDAPDEIEYTYYETVDSGASVGTNDRMGGEIILAQGAFMAIGAWAAGLTVRCL